MTWTLHDEPFRHYKALNQETGKVTWNGARKQRIVSVTDVLDGGADALLQWAIGNTLVAAEKALVTWFPGAAASLATSTLDFGGLAQITGLMPETIRDDKADLGTLAHTYLGWRLSGGVPNAVTRAASLVPYHYRHGIEEFVRECEPLVLRDEHGDRIERAVGDFERAVAGTYDAQVELRSDSNLAVHRLDLKTSNTVQPKHFAQVAAYEELAQLCGEEPSEFVSILHVTPLGEYRLLSLAYGSDDYHMAVELFHYYLQIRRSEARLAKLIR